MLKVWTPVLNPLTNRWAESRFETVKYIKRKQIFIININKEYISVAVLWTIKYDKGDLKLLLLWEDIPL